MRDFEERYPRRGARLLNVSYRPKAAIRLCNTIREKYGNFQNRVCCEGGESSDASGTSPDEAHGRSHPGDSHLLVLRALTDASTTRKLFSTSRPDTVRPLSGMM